MKTTLALFLMLLLAVFAACPETTDTLCIATYNIHNAIGGTDRKTDYDRIVSTITGMHPDFVAIQEADSATTRSRGKDVMRELAQRTGMNSLFAPAIEYGGGRYGIGILSRETPLSVTRIPLPGREEARMLLIAEYSRCYFACTHLSLTEADRETSARILARAAALRTRKDKPFIIAGDWNMTPDSHTLDIITRDFTLLNETTANTFPADRPDSCIDYIAVADDCADCVSVLHTEVINEPAASDHRPVCATIILTPAKAGQN